MIYKPRFKDLLCSRLAIVVTVYSMPSIVITSLRKRWGGVGGGPGEGAGRFAGRLFVCLSTFCSFTYFCSSSLYRRLRSLIVTLPRDFFIICNKIESGVFISCVIFVLSKDITF